MQNPEEKMPSQERNAAERDAQLIDWARNEVVRLRALTRNAIREGKKQSEVPELQYANDFDVADLDDIGPDEASLLDMAMHGDTEEDYANASELARACWKNADALPSAIEKRSRKALLNYINNRLASILLRAEAKAKAEMKK